ncbi:hypothetical protein LCGC14_2598760 [marine sediment metagenome]|uniref:Uncharacterized protein n=1 Tax=marine sediment metagenome TaxID=412755 RepID=A0A0F9CKC2_9ZZZZ
MMKPRELKRLLEEDEWDIAYRWAVDGPPPYYDIDGAREAIGFLARRLAEARKKKKNELA